MIEKNATLNDLKEIFKLYKNNYDPIISDFTKIYVYKIDDSIVSFLIFDIIYERCEIIDIFTCKEFRNKGYAYLLINEVISDYKLDNITLEVEENNINAINLYEKLGFKRAAYRKNYYENNNGLLMIKEIR